MQLRQALHTGLKVLAALAGLSGCERPQAPPAPPGEVVEWRVDTVPKLDLGGIGTGEQYEFYQVRGAVKLSTGQLVVADASARELKFFSSEGVYQFSVGGRGEGPGEFLWIDSLVARAGDTLAVMEHGRRILSEFDQEGALQRSSRLDEDLFISFVGILASGAAIARTAHVIFVDPPSPVLQQDSFSVLSFNRSGNRTRVIDVLPKTVDYSRTFGNCNIGIGDPLGGEVKIAVAGDRIAIGHTLSSQIRMTDQAGRTRFIIETDLKSGGTTAAALARLRDRFRARADDQGPGRCEYGRRALEILDDVPPPQSLPLFDRLVFDDGGNLWIEEFRVEEEEPATWHVFDSEGHDIARAVLPGNVNVTQIGSDFVLGVVWDDMDLERVRLFRLQR